MAGSTAYATFFHGIVVSTASLVFAAYAHQETEDPRLAIDMIIHRQRQGKLRTRARKGMAGRKSVKDIPVEVWLMIRQHLTLSTAVQAEQEAVRDLACDVTENRSCRRWRYWSEHRYACIECMERIKYGEDNEVFVSHTNLNQAEDVYAEVSLRSLPLPHRPAHPIQTYTGGRRSTQRVWTMYPYPTLHPRRF